MKERTLFLIDKEGLVTEVFLKGEPSVVDIIAIKIYNSDLEVLQDSDQN